MKSPVLGLLTFWALAAPDSIRAQSLVSNLQTATTSGAGSSSAITEFVVVGNVAYFAATGVHGRELWITDGTQGGTKLLVDLVPGTASSTPTGLAALGNQLLSAAQAPGIGRELWVTDGTVAGTGLVADIRSGTLSSSPTELVAMGGFVYFAASTFANGAELWRSDGTPAGTTEVIDLNSGPSSSLPRNLTVIGSTLYFTATAGAGRELYKSDGTAAGTALVSDIWRRQLSATGRPAILGVPAELHRWQWLCCPNDRAAE